MGDTYSPLWMCPPCGGQFGTTPPGFSLDGWVWDKAMGTCSSALFSYGELTTGVGVRRHIFWGAALCVGDCVAQCCCDWGGQSGLQYRLALSCVPELYTPVSTI